MNLPDPASLKRCRPFDDVRDDELSPPTIPNPVELLARDSIASYTVNNKPFLDWMKNPPIIKVGTAQEWTIKAIKAPPVVPEDVSNHPFHIHVNPFQVISHTDENGVTTKAKVWRDTLFVPQGHSYVIRSRFRDFSGISVFHCHILDHEDQGMMMPLKFVEDLENPVLPPQDLCDQPIVPQKLLPMAVRAPGLMLVDASGARRTLSQFRQRIVVLVFFQGADCGHCIQALRALIREARGTPGLCAEILAVSSRRIPDSKRALYALEVSAGDRFHLLADESRQTFRDFGGYDAGPTHGVFLIDRDGVIRAKYVGNAPFEDSLEVIRRVRTLNPSVSEEVSR